ncbi:hypothetical protein HPB48_020439 [Haemaphysalis longicornis]|uniref:Uncharacterized protein n=1 Tax=Haemaphysalis longicornis TaxID=44386 RepID=A0A9J6GXW6_HAELO|nr:hypothetical protein HPB48_020439 [Haemaphysalis longicornis]
MSGRLVSKAVASKNRLRRAATSRSTDRAGPVGTPASQPEENCGSTKPNLKNKYLNKLELHVFCSANLQPYGVSCGLIKKINLLWLELPRTLFVSAVRSYVNASFTDLALSGKNKAPKEKRQKHQ